MNSHPDFKLPADILNNFTTDGYVSVRPLCDADQMRELNSEVERFIQDVVPTMPQEQVYYEDMSTLKQLQKMFDGVDFQNLVTVDHLPGIEHTQMFLEDRGLLISTIERRLRAANPAARG